MKWEDGDRWVQGGESWGALGAQKDSGPSTGMWGCLFEGLMFWSLMGSEKPPMSRGRCCRSSPLPSPVARAKLPGAAVSGEISPPGHCSMPLLGMPHAVPCLIPTSRTDAPMVFVAWGGVCSIGSDCNCSAARRWGKLALLAADSEAAWRRRAPSCW